MAICSQVLLTQGGYKKRTAYVYGTPAQGDDITLNDETIWSVDQVLAVLDETEIPRAFQVGW